MFDNNPPTYLFYINAKSSNDDSLIKRFDQTGQFTSSELSFKKFLAEVFANKIIKDKANAEVKTKNVQELKEFWKVQNFIS